MSEPRKAAGPEGDMRWVFGPTMWRPEEDEEVVFLTPARILRCEGCRREIALVREREDPSRISRSLCRACSRPAFPKATTAE